MTTTFYQKQFTNYLQEAINTNEPESLYRPIHYILQLGGKKIRPALTLLTCHLFDEDYQKALSAGLAIEVFHNFTLIHDDIMDKAPIRRGKPTVHTKWNENTAILSGDAMLIMAYQCLESYSPKLFKKLTLILSKTALQVCEGQQYDIDFETQKTVSIKEYIKMIKLKTSVLVAAAMKMGAIIANATKKDAKAIYQYGLNLGLAFQLQDDYLDTFGNQEQFGKKIGGDILENKKTYLYLKALEVANFKDKEELQKWYTSKNKTEEKIKKVTSLFTQNNIPKLTKQQIQKYTQKAFTCLEKTSLDLGKKQKLITFGNSLINRNL